MLLFNWTKLILIWSWITRFAFTCCRPFQMQVFCTVVQPLAWLQLTWRIVWSLFTSSAACYCVVLLSTLCRVRLNYLMLIAGCPPLIVSPLYAALPPSQQLKAFAPTPKVNILHTGILFLLPLLMLVLLWPLVFKLPMPSVLWRCWLNVRKGI